MRPVSHRLIVVLSICIAACGLIFASTSCDFTPDTDETDPVPHIFRGRELPKEQMGPMEAPIPDARLLQIMQAEMEAERSARQKIGQATQAKEQKQEGRAEEHKGKNQAK